MTSRRQWRSGCLYKEEDEEEEEEPAEADQQGRTVRTCHCHHTCDSLLLGDGSGLHGNWAIVRGLLGSSVAAMPSGPHSAHLQQNPAQSPNCGSEERLESASLTALAWTLNLCIGFVLTFDPLLGLTAGTETGHTFTTLIFLFSRN